MLNEIRFELKCIFFSKKSKKIGFILIKKSLGQVKNLGQLALGKCRMALLGARSAFEFWSNLDSLFEDF